MIFRVGGRGVGEGGVGVGEGRGVGVGVGVGVRTVAGAEFCIELELKPKVSKMGGSGNPEKIMKNQ